MSSFHQPPVLAHAGVEGHRLAVTLNESGPTLHVDLHHGPAACGWATGTLEGDALRVTNLYLFESVYFGPLGLRDFWRWLVGPSRPTLLWGRGLGALLLAHLLAQAERRGARLARAEVGPFDREGRVPTLL